LAEAPAYAKHEAESFWTHDYMLRHCEEFRVDLPDRHLGYVEEVVLLPDQSEPIGFLVRGDSGLHFVSVHQIRDFSPRAQRILVHPLPLTRRRSPTRLPARDCAAAVARFVRTHEMARWRSAAPAVIAVPVIAETDMTVGRRR
jgi:hypothetical protein